MSMRRNEITDLFNQFEAAASEYQGIECWSARELQPLLGYAKWENFYKVIEKAKEACENAGGNTPDYFPDVRKIVQTGVGATKEIDDILLTRYAAYLTAQNGDPRKTQIAFAQNYFAVQTRRAELVAQRIAESQRVKARAKLAETEKRLSGVLYERGVDNAGFAVIRSKGDKALFRLDTAQLKRRFSVPDGRPVADFLPTVSIKAKDFAAAMTAENAQIKNLQGTRAIEIEHVENNLGVRKIMIERGLVPENLPPAEDVKKVERRLESENKKVLVRKKK